MSKDRRALSDHLTNILSQRARASYLRKVMVKPMNTARIRTQTSGLSGECSLPLLRHIRMLRHIWIFKNTSFW